MSAATSATSGVVRSLDEVLLLGPPDCPCCREVAEAQQRYFDWFATEGHTDPDERARLAASLGFCPGHSRRLLRSEAVGEIVVGLDPLLARSAIRHLAEATPRTECPACVTEGSATERAVALVLRSLDDARLARRYDEIGGACLDHARELLRRAPPPHARRIAATLRARLAEQTTLEGVLARDDDAVARARLLWRLREEDGADTMLARALARWAQASCPACLAAELVGRRYLSCRLEDEPSVLCSTHIHDLMDMDLAARYELMRVRWAWSLDLDRFLERSDMVVPRRLGGARRVARTLERLKADLLHDRICAVCCASRTAAARELQLLCAAMALEPCRHAFAAAHGLCVRHCADLPATDEARFARSVTLARLGVLLREAQEADRKRGRFERHERPVPEATVHRRLLAQLDGRTFCGAPAVELAT